MHRLFLSDLHLQPDGGELNRAFTRWCLGPACEADEVWILGDLFEYWLGDDISLEWYASEVRTLAVLAGNTPLHFLPGNRDFLCGRQMATATGMTLHREPVTLPAASGAPRVVLMHGDRLCTDDHEYQRYRALVRQRWVQWLFVHTPAPWRQRIAQRIREASRQRQAAADIVAITDASPAAANAALRSSRAQVLIHGHTHRPATHAHQNGTRYVLPDWRPGTPGSFGWLEQYGAQFGFRTLPHGSGRGVPVAQAV